jgi:para-nitrobenzyl esterase
VPTQSGAVGGVSVGAENEWRGIPYAAPPVGALRWRPPAAVTPWSGVRGATAFAPACIQVDFDGGTLGSEDCLYLNVFAPSDATAGSNLAVMVHLHPGGNFFGDAYQDASAFTARGVIVVTVGYRLGVLGFMGHSLLTAEGGGQSGEYAGLDQLAALRWVHDNISAFGGDPNNVTLFGSSAGSFDTVALMASPLSHGLITRAAVQGGVFSSLTGFDTYTVSVAEGFGGQVASAAGCGSSSDVLECLRALPAAALVLAADSLGWGDIDNPPLGSTELPQPPLQLIANGPAIPLLAGFDREEEAGFFGLPTPYTTSNWIKDTVTLVGPNFAAAARKLYPPASYDSLLWDYITMRTDAGRGCPTRRLANTLAERAPVWRYLYTHTYETDPSFAQFRASHVFEEQFLWGEDVFGSGYVLAPAEQLLSQRMTDYWTNFAKTGNPNSPGLPTWPQYNTTSEPTLTLDDQIGVITGYHDQQCALLDSLTHLFPLPWAPGNGPQGFVFGPPAFVNGHARAIP